MHAGLVLGDFSQTKRGHPRLLAVAVVQQVHGFLAVPWARPALSREDALLNIWRGSQLTAMATLGAAVLGSTCSSTLIFVLRQRR